MPPKKQKKVKKATRTYMVPIRWQVIEVCNVEASSVKEAMELAMDGKVNFDACEFDCPEIDESEVTPQDDDIEDEE